MFLRPATLEEVFDRLDAGARLLAGGTDIMTTAGAAALGGDIVDIARLAELRGLSRNEKEIRIGAATTWGEIARAELPPAFDALKSAAREVGALQIQNRATVAGNLCNASPAADGVPPLLALDAQVELASRRGARRLPLAQFVTGARRTDIKPGEVVTAIVCPTPPPGMRSAFLKLGARRYLVISIVMVAVALDEESGEARVAVGACSPVAMRVGAAERRLARGDALVARDFDALTPIGDLRASADYRREAALVLTRRAAELCGSGQGGSVL